VTRPAPAPTASDESAPRKAGWWSRRFGSGE
jgi:ribonuclease E